MRYQSSYLGDKGGAGVGGGGGVVGGLHPIVIIRHAVGSLPRQQQIISFRSPKKKDQVAKKRYKQAMGEGIWVYITNKLSRIYVTLTVLRYFTCPAIRVKQQPKLYKRVSRHAYRGEALRVLR